MYVIIVGLPEGHTILRRWTNRGKKKIVRHGRCSWALLAARRHHGRCSWALLAARRQAPWALLMGAARSSHAARSSQASTMGAAHGRCSQLAQWAQLAGKHHCSQLAQWAQLAGKHHGRCSWALLAGKHHGRWHHGRCSWALRWHHGRCSWALAPWAGRHHGRCSWVLQGTMARMQGTMARMQGTWAKAHGHGTRQGTGCHGMAQHDMQGQGMAQARHAKAWNP